MREHRMEIEIEATPEEVWQSLTEEAGLERWFAPVARVTQGVGGSVYLSWGEGMEGTAPIHLWEPGRRFGWTEGPKKVEFEIVPGAGGGGTKLHLVHSGFGAEANFDNEYDSTLGGWTIFLAMFRHGAAHFRGRPARHVYSLRMIDQPVDAVWSRFRFSSLAEGAECRAELGGGLTVEGRVIRYLRPGYLCLETGGDTIVGVFVEKGGKGRSMFTLQAILFGEAAMAGDQQWRDGIASAGAAAMLP